MNKVIAKDEWKEVNVDDLIGKGIFDDFQYNIKDVLANPDLEGAEEIFKVSNQSLKSYFSQWDIELVKKALGVINSERPRNSRGLIPAEVATDYFTQTIDELNIFGRRDMSVGPKSFVDKKSYWFFRGYLTLEEYECFKEIYPKFKERFKEYKTHEYRLHLDIIGGIRGNRLLVDIDSKRYWEERNIIVESFGFGKDGHLVSTGDVVMGDLYLFDKEIEEIKKRGKPRDLREARLLNLEGDSEQIWLGELNKYYND